MSISIHKNLDTLCPVDNPMELILLTDNHLSDPGTKAQFNLVFNNIDTIPGHFITFSWADLTIQFILAESPDDSGKQLHSAFVGQPVADWVDILCEDFLNNYYLSRDFDIEVKDSARINFKAKTVGEKFTLDLKEITITGTSHNSYVIGEDAVLRDFYSLVVRLISDEGDNIGEDFVAPDASGKSTFDLHDLFCDYLIPEFTWPQPSDQVCVYRENFVREFTVRYAETFDREVKLLNTLTGQHFAVLGGFDYKMLAALNGVSYSLLDFITTFKAFLTWQPTIKPISLIQREKLFYLVFDNIKVLKSFVKIYFTDGTSSSNTLIGIHAVDQYKVFEFFTGYEALGIDSLIGEKQVLKYDFWLEDDSSSVKSQVRTYEIDFRPYTYERTFIFLNSFGAYDVFRATGRKKNLNKYERMVLERNISEISVSKQYQALETETFHVNSGYLNKGTKNWLRELMLSEDVYEIIGDYKFPILIQNEEETNHDDLETIYELDIVYKYSFKNPKYSNQVNLLPLLAENLNALLNEDGNLLFG